jgi:hypothetical protein
LQERAFGLLANFPVRGGAKCMDGPTGQQHTGSVFK